jgi:cysteine desulfurase
MLYLDHAATTPIDPDIRLGMMQRFESSFANPSSKHALGRQARQELEHARARIAAVIGAEAGQIVFTGGGTEALGLAVLGSAGDQAARIAISAVEHSAVSESAYWLRDRLGWQVDVLPVDDHGRVKLSDLTSTVNAQTRIVAVMLVNNEVGSINDIAAIAAVLRRKCPRAKLVVDAVQAFAKLPMDVDALGADLMAFTSHKIYGPKGLAGCGSNGRRPCARSFAAAAKKLVCAAELNPHRWPGLLPKRLNVSEAQKQRSRVAVSACFR